MTPAWSHACAHRIRIPGVDGAPRDGLLLEWGNNPVRWTEASPLPGWSGEDFPATLDAFNRRSPSPPSALQAALDAALPDSRQVQAGTATRIVDPFVRITPPSTQPNADPKIYLLDTQPVVREAAYAYVVVRFEPNGEIRDVVPVPAVTIP